MKVIETFIEAYDLSLRIFFLILAVSLGTALIFIGSKAAMAVGLKENVVLEDNMITLGDVFYNLPRDEDRVLGAAPQPGSEMVLNARTLMRVAIAMDLPWRPASSADHVVLRRAATVIEQEVLEHAISAALEDKGLQGKFDLAFTGGPSNIILPPDAEPEMEISSLNWDSQRDRFDAVIVAPSKDNPIKRVNISGSIVSLVNVPVFKDTIRHGTIIGKHDIDFIEVPGKTLKHDTVLKANEIIGKTPQRMVLAGKPIKANDIEAPQIVKRGEMITMVFKEGPLMLTAQGKALENGAEGDFIRVVNVSSNKTIQAVVSGDKEVMVRNF